jgi:hypothetical protein
VTHNERRRGQRPGATIKSLRLSTSGAAGNGMRTTMKYLHGAAGIGLGTTIKYLRRATSAAANNGLGNTTKYHVNQNAGAGDNWAEAHVHKSWERTRTRTNTIPNGTEAEAVGRILRACVHKFR